MGIEQTGQYSGGISQYTVGSSEESPRAEVSSPSKAVLQESLLTTQKASLSTSDKNLSERSVEVRQGEMGDIESKPTMATERALQNYRVQELALRAAQLEQNSLAMDLFCQRLVHIKGDELEKLCKLDVTVNSPSSPPIDKAFNLLMQHGSDSSASRVLWALKVALDHKEIPPHEVVVVLHQSEQALASIKLHAGERIEAAQAYFSLLQSLVQEPESADMARQFLAHPKLGSDFAKELVKSVGIDRASSLLNQYAVTLYEVAEACPSQTEQIERLALELSQQLMQLKGIEEDGEKALAFTVSNLMTVVPIEQKELQIAKWAYKSRPRAVNKSHQLSPQRVAYLFHFEYGHQKAMSLKKVISNVEFFIIDKIADGNIEGISKSFMRWIGAVVLDLDPTTQQLQRLIDELTINPIDFRGFLPAERSKGLGSVRSTLALNEGDQRTIGKLYEQARAGQLEALEKVIFSKDEADSTEVISPAVLQEFAVQNRYELAAYLQQYVLDTQFNQLNEPAAWQLALQANLKQAIMVSEKAQSDAHGMELDDSNASEPDLTSKKLGTEATGYDMDELEARYNRLMEGKDWFPPSMTGGAIYSQPWRDLKGKDEAKAFAQLYVDARAHGSARLWADSKQWPSALNLTEQARKNWMASEQGNAFSGMIDCRTGDLYLVPATARKVSSGEQVNQTQWKYSVLKQQFFTPHSHVGDNTRMPNKGSKLQNCDHNRAASYLEEKEHEVTHAGQQGAEVRKGRDWLMQQQLASNWLGFFVYSDRETGAKVFNFKSAQLNVPNLVLPDYDLSTIFEENEDGRVKVADFVQSRESMVQLPKGLRNLIVSALDPLPTPPKSQAIEQLTELGGTLESAPGSHTEELQQQLDRVMNVKKKSSLAEIFTSRVDQYLRRTNG